MTRAVVVSIPAPADWINSNHRPHWAERSRRSRAWRMAAYLYARQLQIPTFHERVEITATAHKTRGGRWDAANLYPTAKAAVDGLVDAGVLVDDDNPHVIGPDMRAGEKRERPTLVLRIEVAS